jgi:hypothetical protein
MMTKMMSSLELPISKSTRKRLEDPIHLNISIARRTVILDSICKIGISAFQGRPQNLYNNTRLNFGPAARNMVIGDKSQSANQV